MAKVRLHEPPPLDSLRSTLRRMHKNMDTDAALDSLLSPFSGSRSIVEMDEYQLRKAFPKRTAQLIHCIPGVARATLRNDYPVRPIIGCMEDAGKFLPSLFLGKRIEQCYLLLLRKNRYLICERMIQSGTVDSMPFYPRNILLTALQYEADAIVIAHNHPGGTPSPSADDINSTVSLISALAPLEIPLLDHMIYARDTIVSIRAGNLIHEDVWLSQPNHCPKFLSTWLEPATKDRRKPSTQSK